MDLIRWLFRSCRGVAVPVGAVVRVEGQDLALSRLGVVLEELSHDRLGLLLDLLHEALVGLVGSTRVVLDQVGEGTGRDHRADLLLVSQYGFAFALIGGPGGLAHAMASLPRDALSESPASPRRVARQRGVKGK